MAFLNQLSSALSRLTGRQHEPAAEIDHLAAENLRTDYSTVMKSHSSQGISLTGFSI